MPKRKLKPFVLPILYSLIIVAFAISVFFIQKVLQEAFKTNDDIIENTSYVDSEIINILDTVPVVATPSTIIKPYLATNVEIAKSFYDYKADNEAQEKSLIYYENTYMQNSGVDYKSAEKFDVVSILDGTVINLKSDEILGTIIEIRHNDDLISVYQSMSDVIVKMDDKVMQGQIIGKSGLNNLNKDLKDHLHFELFYQGQVVNPENYYGKKIEEL